MIAPIHWAKGSYKGLDRDGHEMTFQAWGWSHDSLAAAREHGVTRAKRAAESVKSGKPRDTYDYLDSPLREEVVRTLTCGTDATAVITRNSYGVLVLNAASVCFVDVDFPAPRARGVLDALALLFSAARRQARARAQQDETIRAVREWSQRHPSHGLRLYRTAAGLRLLFTDGLYDPNSAVVHEMLAGLGSDPLYRRLTSKQQCFRARLTPKPWRCGCDRPPSRFPWETAAAEQAYRHWQEDYEAKAKPFATCRLIESLGPSRPWEDTLAMVVAAHDELACATPERPLA